MNSEQKIAKEAKREVICGQMMTMPLPLCYLRFLLFKIWWHQSLTLFVVSVACCLPGLLPADDEFQTLYREWNSLEKRLTDLQGKYEEAAPTARVEIKKQYEQLVQRSKELLPKLCLAAEAAYAAEPNKDADVLRTLIGIMAHDYRYDDY